MSFGLGSRKLSQEAASTRAPAHPSIESVRRAALLCRVICIRLELPWLEAGVEAEGDLPRLRVRAEIEPLVQIRQGVLADLGVVAGVVRLGEEVLSADVELQRAHTAQPRAPEH